MIDALVIGGGPAGLMAAQMLHDTGARVLLAEAKPSLGRKFLMAGKSGLNLTKDEPLDRVMQAYGAAQWLSPMITAFGPAQIQDWARQLGQPVFTGTTGRVFPVAMKASPLLRAWLGAMPALQVETRWRWTGFDGAAACFDTPLGFRAVTARATVLALGGASWARLGSDGLWCEAVQQTGATVTPFAPANVGFQRPWSRHMQDAIGQPVKSIALLVAGQAHRGEIMISTTGLEGGGIYAVSALIRDGAPLEIDFLPDLSLSQVHLRLATRPGKETRTNKLRKALGMTGARLALFHELAHGKPGDLASLLKQCPVDLGPPQPIDRAISTAGGIARTSVDDRLMLTARPGTFVAGEMLDWEAPTGGYLLTACLATGRWAGLAAADWLDNHP